MPSGSLGGNKNEFSVTACSQAKEVGYTAFDAQEKLIRSNKRETVYELICLHSSHPHSKTRGIQTKKYLESKN